MVDIFIAYRREDSADASGRIYDRLVALYGQRRVFRDVMSIEGGQRFPASLENAITEQTTMLVIIGERWLQILQQRREDPYDFCRIEIEIALRQRATIIPVLIQGARMPAREELPPSVADLANFHAVNVRQDPDFANDMDLVRRALGLHVRSARRTIPWLGLVSVLLLVALAGTLFWRLGMERQSARLAVPPTVTPTFAPLHCTDAQGNYPDGFKPTGSQHAVPLAPTPGISGQRLLITGSGSTESAFANARVYFDATNYTCTSTDPSRPGTVHGYFNFINDTSNSYQIEAADFSLTEVPNIPYDAAQLQAYPLGVIPNIVIVNQHIYAYIKNLSRRNLQDIFTGRATHWSQIDPVAPDEPIDTIWTGDKATLPAGWPESGNLDSLYTLNGPLVSFKRDVLGNELGVAAPSQMIATGQLDVLKAVLNDPDSIGFISLPSLDFYAAADPSYHFKDMVHFVTIDNYAPESQGDISSNNYAFWNIAYAYIKASVGDTAQGKAAAALISDIVANPSFTGIDIPELDWLPLEDFSPVVLRCHETKDPCN